MFDQTALPEARNAIGDWILRGAVAIVFVLFGAEKFSSAPDGHWISLFDQIGFGRWFRYFTGAVEMLGGLLVVVPPTVTLGLLVLGCTMLGAALIPIFILGRPGDSVIPLLFLIGLTVFWRSRTAKS